MSETIENGVGETRAGTTLILTISQPARRNAISMLVREALTAALERAETDSEIRAIVLTGAGGTFSAGGDLSSMEVADLAVGRERFRRTHRMVHAMLQSSKPLIAAVEGWAAGAGLSLALCCDTVVAAEDARFMASFGKVGLIADCGLLYTLPQRVGMGHARQILLYGQPVSAGEGERIGLVDHLVPKGRAIAKALELSEALTAIAPLPIAMTKRYLAEGLESALAFERDTQASLFLTEDHREGREAFLAKRRPEFRGV